MIEPVWAVCVQEWDGAGYVERIVGPFTTEADAEQFVENCGEVASTFDLLPPSEWRANV